MAQYCCKPQSVPTDKIQKTVELDVPKGSKVRFEFSTNNGGGKTSDISNNVIEYGRSNEFVLSRTADGGHKVDIHSNIKSIFAVVKDEAGTETKIDLLKSSEITADNKSTPKAITPAGNNSTSPETLVAPNPPKEIPIIKSPPLVKAELPAPPPIAPAPVVAQENLQKLILPIASNAFDYLGKKLNDGIQGLGEIAKNLEQNKKIVENNVPPVTVTPQPAEPSLSISLEPNISLPKDENIPRSSSKAPMPVLEDIELTPIQKIATGLDLKALLNQAIAKEAEQNVEDIFVEEIPKKDDHATPPLEKKTLDLNNLKPGTELTYKTPGGIPNPMKVPTQASDPHVTFRGRFVKNTDASGNYSFIANPGEKLEISLAGTAGKGNQPTTLEGKSASTSKPVVTNPTTAKNHSTAMDPLDQSEAFFNDRNRTHDISDVRKYLKENPDAKVLIVASAWYCDPCAGDTPHYIKFLKNPENEGVKIFRLDVTKDNNVAWSGELLLRNIPNVFVYKNNKFDKILDEAHSYEQLEKATKEAWK